MAQIECSEFKKILSEKASPCPVCGCSVDISKENKLHCTVNLDDKHVHIINNNYLLLTNIFIIIIYAYSIFQLTRHNGVREILYNTTNGNYLYIIMSPLLPLSLSLIGIYKISKWSIFFSLFFVISSLAILYIFYIKVVHIL